ncbi:hypothetical protein [Methylobacterium oryzisoli]|uniref:hypothetical protein n=1 Tax=Methylobacterium oryzisoli TaxID=3385502 RepID=UPI003892ADEE
MRLPLFFCILLTLTTFSRADEILSQGRIKAGGPNAGDIVFGTLKLGKRLSGKTVLQPNAVEIQGNDAKVSVPSTGGYWKDRGGIPANFTRLNDRVMIGAAADWDGTFAGYTSNWQWYMGNGIYNYLLRNAQVGITSRYSQPAAVFAADTASSSGLPGEPTSTCCAMPLGLLAYNNNTTNPQGMWGIYITGGRIAGTGSWANEIDVFNASNTVVKLTPYTSSATAGVTLGLAIQSGGEAVEAPGGTPAFPQLSAATAALLIAGNGSTFDRGIVFRQLTISDTFPKAIDLPANYRMRWTHDASDQTEAFISANVGDYSKAIGLQFNSIGAAFQDPTLSGTYGMIQWVPNVANYPTLAGGPTGGPVYFAANGPDANIDVLIAPKGVGALVMPSISLLPLGTPPNSGAQCRPGQIAADASYLYVCRATNDWRRIALGAAF